MRSPVTEMIGVFGLMVASLPPDKPYAPQGSGSADRRPSIPDRSDSRVED